MMDSAVDPQARVVQDARVDPDTRAPKSPFRSLLGLRVVEWGPDVCVVEVPLRDALTNFSGAAAGPVLAAAIDMAGALSGCHMPGLEPTRRAVTLSFAVSFVQASTGGLIRARGVRLGGGKKVFTSTVTVSDHAGHTLATGQGTFRYVTVREAA